jgi:hypothetical protein
MSYSPSSFANFALSLLTAGSLCIGAGSVYQAQADDKSPINPAISAADKTAPKAKTTKPEAKTPAKPNKGTDKPADKAGNKAGDKTADKADAKTPAAKPVPEINLDNFAAVTTSELVNKPHEYVGKNIKFKAKFFAFGALALDYKPALRPAKTHLSFMVLNSSNDHVPLSELKIAMVLPKEKDPDNAMLISLKQGDEVEVYGKVFSAALDDPWVDVVKLKKLKEDKKEDKKDDKKADKPTGKDDKDAKDKQSSSTDGTTKLKVRPPVEVTIPKQTDIKKAPNIKDMYDATPIFKDGMPKGLPVPENTPSLPTPVRRTK